MRVSGHGGFSRVGGGGKEFQSFSKELANEMVEDNQFKYKRESEKDIKDFFQIAAQTKNGITVNDDGEIVTKKSIAKKAEALAEKLADRIEFIDREVKDAYDDLRSKTKGIYRIDPRGEIDNFREYQKNSAVKVIKGAEYKDPEDGHYKRAISIDSKYETLYNDGANRWGLTNPSGEAAKLRELNDTLRDLKSRSKYNIYSDRARSELGATPSEIKRSIRDNLIMNAGMAQTMYEPQKKGRKKK